jgi:hypothetical protein
MNHGDSAFAIWLAIKMSTQATGALEVMRSSVRLQVARGKPSACTPLDRPMMKAGRKMQGDWQEGRYLRTTSREIDLLSWNSSGEWLESSIVFENAPPGSYLASV